VVSAGGKDELVITTIRWSYYGTKGAGPDINKNYAGLVVYDIGTFKWKEEVRPGYACIMDIDELKFDDEFDPKH